MMLALFDQETLMKNHDASVERKAEKKGRKETADLMAYLAKSGRTDDIEEEDDPKKIFLSCGHGEAHLRDAG